MNIAPWEQLAQRVGVRVVAEPTVEPIDLDTARQHLRIVPYGFTAPAGAAVRYDGTLQASGGTVGGTPTHPDDQWLQTVGIPAARDYCERYTARSIAKKTLELARNGFPSSTCTGIDYLHRGYFVRDESNSLDLPLGPVRAIEVVSYTDADGLDQTVSAFTLSNYAEPAMLTPAFSAVWPAARVTPNSLRVRYFVGYTLPGDSPNDRPLPASIRAAMLLLLGHLYENRENTTIGRAANIQEIPLGVEALLEPYVLRLSMA